MYQRNTTGGRKRNEAVFTVTRRAALKAKTKAGVAGTKSQWDL